MRLEVDEPGSTVAEAVDAGGGIIGLATAGVSRDRDALTPWELYSINVVADQQGSGLADDLIRVSAGDRDTTVWVRSDNARARSFYRRHGFTLEGASTVDEATGLSQVRMVRRFAERKRVVVAQPVSTACRPDRSRRPPLGLWLGSAFAPGSDGLANLDHGGPAAPPG